MMKDSAYSNSNASPKNKSFLTIVIVLVFLVICVSLLSLKKPTKDSNQAPKPNTPNTQTRTDNTPPPNAPVYTLKFASPDSVWKAGGKYKVNLQVEKVDKNLTAATLKLTYDPKFLKVDNITAGDVWTKSNDFVKKLDTPGKVEYTYVRALGTEVSDKTTLAVLDVSVLDGAIGSTPIALDPDSQIATVVEHVNYRVMAEPLLLSISN